MDQRFIRSCHSDMMRGRGRAPRGRQEALGLRRPPPAPGARPCRRRSTGRDSLVVLPTGGGKSLCYQAPAVVRDGLTVVVSPLIALMKDQVDGLHACGVAGGAASTARLTSDRSARSHERDRCSGDVRLLFVSPERLVTPARSPRPARRVGVGTFAIDEAHCISHWGHDFRPEYRQLGRLTRALPRRVASTPTPPPPPSGSATTSPSSSACTTRDVLVGNFDRPEPDLPRLPRLDLSEAGPAR